MMFVSMAMAQYGGYQSNTYTSGSMTNTHIQGNNGYNANVQGYDYGNGFKTATGTDSQGNTVRCQTYNYGNGRTTTSCN